MRAVWMRFRCELRSRWRSWLILAVLAGVFGGAVVAAAAGARRTDSVVDRYVATKQPPNVYIAPEFIFEDDLAPKLSFTHLLELDSVAAGARRLLLPVNGEFNVEASEDPRLGTETFPTKLFAGRLPDPRRPDEALANVVAAERFRLEPGDTYTVGFFGAWNNPEGGPSLPGPTVTFRITGIAADLGDFATNAQALLTLTPAFLEKHGGDIDPVEVALLRLKDGTASYDEFARELNRITEGRTAFYDETGRWDEARASFGLQAKALWILASLLAALTVLVVGQAIARQMFLDAGENGTLVALGLTRGQLTTIALLRAAWIGLTAAVIAVIIAAAASPLTPFGSARQADPDPAFSFPVVAMGLGFGGILLGVVGIALYPAFRMAGHARDTEAVSGLLRRPGRLVGVVSRFTRNPSPAIGTRMAFERGRGRTAVPVRTTIVATAVCLTALAVSLIVGASLNRLSADPSLYGWTWDTSVYSSVFYDDPGLEADGPVAQAVLREMNGVAAVTFSSSTVAIRFNGITIDAFGLPLDASITPPIMEGRAPSAPEEVAMARKTMRDAGVDVGDTVQIGLQGSAIDRPFRVVGATVLPFAGGTTLGEGIWIPLEGLETSLGVRFPTDRALVRFKSGADVDQLENFIEVRFEASIEHAESPGSVVDFGRVSQMPLLLAGIVAALAAGTLAHGLLTAIHRRRRDLAILKSLGFDRHQIRSAVSWQATATTLLTLAIGLSVGVLVGRWLWTTLANNTGFVAEPVTELPMFGIAVAAALAGVNLIALLPGRAAARTPAAVVLRTE